MGIPSVLVVLPMFNSQRHIRTAVESILSQSFQDFALLVIDDGSVDQSAEQVLSIRDKRIEIWRQTNQGLGSTINRGLKHAVDSRIPFLARMDSDDISLPRRLEVQISLLSELPAAAGCSSNCQYIRAEDGSIIGASTVASSPGLIKWEISHGLRGMIHGASIFRTEALAGIGGYRPKFQHAEDVDLFLRLSEWFELVNSSEYLYQIRLRSDSLSIKDARRNVHYQFFALECASRRRRGLPEQDFDGYVETMSLLDKARIWREEAFLRLWRRGLARNDPFAKIAAGIVDPRRVVARIMRRL